MNISAPIIRDNTQQPPKGPTSIWFKVLVACNLLLLISIVVIGSMLMSTRRSLDETTSQLSDLEYEVSDLEYEVNKGDAQDPLPDQLGVLEDKQSELQDKLDIDSDAISSIFEILIDAGL